MAKVSFKLEASFFEGLLRRCEAERERVNKEMGQDRQYVGGFIGQGFVMPYEVFPPGTLPTNDQLVSLIETAFWASLEREEGRPLAFNIAYDSPSSDDPHDFAFHPSLPFDRRTITKLAPATDSSCTLGVDADSGGDLRIWGFSTTFKGPLRIKAIDQGKLIVSYAGKNIALIWGADASFISETYLVEAEVIWQPVRKVGLGNKYAAYPEIKRDAVLVTLREMRRLGHGGAFIIVPFGDRWRVSTNQPIKYSGKGSFNLLNSLVHDTAVSAGDDGYYADKTSLLRSRLENAARTLAHLTAVDGATIVDIELNIFGFGVKLEPAPDASEPPTIYKINPLDSDELVTRVKLADLGGTRHQSAARFIFNQRDAVALVVSQDGNITALVWQNDFRHEGKDALCMYGGLELTLF